MSVDWRWNTLQHHRTNQRRRSSWNRFGRISHNFRYRETNTKSSIDQQGSRRHEQIRCWTNSTISISTRRCWNCKKNQWNSFNDLTIVFSFNHQIDHIVIGIDGKGLAPSWHLDQVEIEKENEVYKWEILSIEQQLNEISNFRIDLSPMKFSIYRRRTSIWNQFHRVNRNSYWSFSIKVFSGRPPTPVESSRKSNGDDKRKPICRLNVSCSIFVRLRRPMPNRIPDNAHLYVIIKGKSGEIGKIVMQRDSTTGQIQQQFVSEDIGEVNWHEHFFLYKESNPILHFRSAASL